MTSVPSRYPLALPFKFSPYNSSLYLPFDAPVVCIADPFFFRSIQQTPPISTLLVRPQDRPLSSRLSLPPWSRLAFGSLSIGREIRPPTEVLPVPPFFFIRVFRDDGDRR